jgi:hypothetical protein
MDASPRLRESARKEATDTLTAELAALELVGETIAAGVNR